MTSITNHAEAGPSMPIRENTITSKQSLVSPKLELADKVEIYPSTTVETCLDYSLLVSNTISMARDQLANERNWLTWFRLSCTLIILGFTVLLQFRLPEPDGETQDRPDLVSNRPVGFIFVAIGFLSFLVGLGKYFKNQRQLVKQATYVEAGWGSYVVVIILFFFVCTIMILASRDKDQSSFLTNSV